MQQTYPYPQTVSHIICSDLDETFLPFYHKEESGIPELEAYLKKSVIPHSMIFGLITGSNLDSAMRKLQENATCFPHFIASSLGTELHWFSNGQPIESEEWAVNVKQSGYQQEDIHFILNRLKELDIHLTFQADDYQGKYNSTLYYYIRENIESDIATVQRIASDYHMKVLFNRCNPSAGDPENSYDVQFMPHCTGKGEVVDFLMEKFNLPAQQVYCFGDSFNDFSMFSRTPNAYLVANADPEAKRQHPKVLDKKYCHGIKAKLEEMLG